MTTLPLIGGLSVGLGLILLLVSLNLVSLWRWWIKAAAILVTLGGLVILYFSMTGLIGWASTGAMPARFSLLSTRIVEPDKLRGTEGHIYLWVEEVDTHQVVIGPPRAFEVPYKVEIATDVATAQEQISGGGKVLGQFAATVQAQPDRSANVQSRDEGTPELAGGSEKRDAGTGGEGGESIGDTGALTFTEMPPVDLPDKASIVTLDGP